MTDIGRESSAIERAIWRDVYDNVDHDGPIPGSENAKRILYYYSGPTQPVVEDRLNFCK